AIADFQLITVPRLVHGIYRRKEIPLVKRISGAAGLLELPVCVLQPKSSRVTPSLSRSVILCKHGMNASVEVDVATIFGACGKVRRARNLRVVRKFTYVHKVSILVSGLQACR